MWHVYILECRSGTLYTGVTTDVDRRLLQHNAGKGGAYTRAKKPVALTFKEVHLSRSSALKREAQIKEWPKAKKERVR